MGKLSALIVDDHAITREGVALRLDSFGIRVVGQAASIREGTSRLLVCQPDVAVIDFQLPDGEGTTLIKQATAENLETKCVLYTGHEAPYIVNEALRAGARACVSKQSDPAILLAAVRHVIAGETFIDGRCRSAMARAPQLTDELLTTLRLVVADETNARIAYTQHLTPDGAAKRVNRLRTIFGARTRRDLANKACDLGVVRRP